METISLYVLIVVLVLCIIATIKNQITYRISCKWIDEVFDRPDWNSLRHKLPEYGTLFWDMKRWTYISFENYLKSKEKQ